MHATRSPSSAHRWIICPGSPTIEATCELSPPSFHALQGNVAHALGENVLTNGPNKTPSKIKLKVIRESRQKGKHLIEVVKLICSVNIDQEMLDNVEAYTSHIEKFPIGSRLNGPFIEKRVKFYKTFGTVDCFFICDDTLYVIDLKYGTKKVKARNNPQLAIYGLGALEFLKLRTPKNISLCIFQPRVAGVLDEWKLPVKKFVNVWRPKIKFALMNTEKKKDTFIPGDHCWFCRAHKICPAKQQQVQERARKVFKDA